MTRRAEGNQMRMFENAASLVLAVAAQVVAVGLVLAA